MATDSVQRVNFNIDGIIPLKGGSIMSLGSRIRSLRKELGLTQNEFAAKLGIHGRQLSRYEVDVNKPSIDILIKIADLCEISLDYLGYGKDRKLSKRSRIDDKDLLEIVRRIDRLKKNQRDKVKWAIKGLLSNNK